MICHICKDKVASIRLKEIINDAVTELHLCQACYEAREREGTGVSQPLSADALNSLAGVGIDGSESGPTSCPACGTTDGDFRERGRFGCSDCYKVFAVSLESVLTKIHGSIEHQGKLPHSTGRNLDLKNELRLLQEGLQDAISSENYERAAKLRDRIKQYEDM